MYVSEREVHWRGRSHLSQRGPPFPVTISFSVYIYCLSGRCFILCRCVNKKCRRGSRGVAESVICFGVFGGSSPPESDWGYAVKVGHIRKEQRKCKRMSIGTAMVRGIRAEI